ncbi:MAG TPA: alpha/beta fold hydrolase [Methylomirabilota bacterium]|jgi:dipeptidyl aminopeptidase/acylaminoacyl peptidase|nr:alpha/beta fold hydrolase [Methylomirabilota bacterium]
MEKRTVTFFSEGARLEGDLFLPDGVKAGEPRPGIVLCHGFTGLRAVILPDYARVFAAAGFVVLTFDYRGFGGSEGTKWRLIPLEQIDDIRNAITYLQRQPEVDPERIGLWGTSFGGGHAPYTAGIDARVKAVVGQVGFGDGERLILDSRGYGERVRLMQKIQEDRWRRVREGMGETLDAVAILNAEQTRAFLEPLLKTNPAMKCELSWETVEKTLEYKPIEVVHKISPRPLLLIGARDDDTCPIEGYEKLYEKAGEPKKLAVLPITHYEIYSGKWFDESARLAREWFTRFLL